MSKNKKSFKKPSVDSILEETLVVEETPVVEETYIEVEAPVEKPIQRKKEVLLESGVNRGSKFVNRVLHVNGKEARYATRAAAISAKKRYGGKVVEKDGASEVHK